MIISSIVSLKKEEKKRSKNKNEVKRLSNPFGRFATGPTTRSDASNPVVERELVKRHFPRCKVPAISTGEMHPADASVPRRQTQTTIDFELTRNFDAPRRESESEREEEEGAESETGDKGETATASKDRGRLRRRESSTKRKRLSWRCGGRAGGDENMERRRETRWRRIRGGGLENTDHGETSAEAKREREKGNIHRREDEERNGEERSGGERRRRRRRRGGEARESETGETSRANFNANELLHWQIIRGSHLASRFFFEIVHSEEGTMRRNPRVIVQVSKSSEPASTERLDIPRISPRVPRKGGIERHSLQHLIDLNVPAWQQRDS
ncbi:hypothetical protein ALC53_03553 [Atta colombica]|uniref:Uncharacterized protein n=1 Tax=Atta colombica TaxID=520822 RepID=A0A195BP42_9HYME|nr:hypothetical protein ALC53_03553 [Atta colombica]